MAYIHMMIFTLRSRPKFRIFQLRKSQIQLDASHPTRHFFQFVSDWQMKSEQISVTLTYFVTYLGDIMTYSHHIPTTTSTCLVLVGFGLESPAACYPSSSGQLENGRDYCAVDFCLTTTVFLTSFSNGIPFFFLSGKWENQSRLFWITRMGEVS